MRNPKTNPEIESIKNRLRQEILPEGYIPNSRVAKQIDLLDATATLEYAKKQNRPVRRALPGECEAKRKDIYKQYQKKQQDYMYNSKEAAEELGISRNNLWYHKNVNNITPIKVGKRNYFTEAEIIRFRACVLQAS
ncbi:uncharacterized protein CHSO_1061 [Chryseobacterium sp. StRB126]|uniref:helix-turn-helix domain-containing protein n=1 Tax=Chryseobacterium sp. StRB126 TaxID=878220 RepID=UPI0004E996AE|nr:helix-turn-helix domain-containing protein [Chryseobacterium sp. StRB126]BAP30098.1 uncharacterized protein CHSO_1061 [Chryseobacterium sp. StRB126]